jgi:signal transduction histidine kinase
MQTQDEDSLEPGRKRTDHSLRAERAKTDASLSEVSQNSKQLTDRAIFKSRLESNEKMSHSRDEFDRLRGTESENRPPSDAGREVHNDTHAHLQRERQTADDVLENERRRMDTYLEDERIWKTTAERELLCQERQETDKDLEDERRETDAGIRRSIDAFASECESHSVTRASLATRDEFLAIVSHDLRNPLTSIAMASHLLARQPCLQGEGTSKSRHFIDMIRRNAEEALRLISDLLDMENIAQGKLSLQLKPHDLHKIILQAMEMFEQAAVAKDISLQLDPSIVSTFSVCDRDRMTQVLANLIGNAIKFTQEGGTIIVMLNPLEDLFDISVTDNGPGIQADMQQKIFKRFSQIGRDDRRGLGLGLHISRMIVEAHGGRIWVDSEPGHGSKFHFTLPKAQKPEPPER